MEFVIFDESDGFEQFDEKGLFCIFGILDYRFGLISNLNMITLLDLTDLKNLMKHDILNIEHNNLN